MKTEIEMRIDVDATDANGRALLAPQGMTTPHLASTGCVVEGGTTEIVTESTTGQALLRVVPTARQVSFIYGYTAGGAPYPDVMFEHRANRYTSAADELIREAETIGAGLPAAERAGVIASDTARRFTYGHPEKRFYDGFDEIPHLGCGLTEGSCVDINAYFIASLRAAGIEAGYMTGCFFPAEKAGRCDDMHCWVVTRADGLIEEWDIAHHLKMGTRQIRPALNPKPGMRVALAHSMGLDVPALGVSAMKLLSEPVWVADNGALAETRPTIRCSEGFVAA